MAGAAGVLGETGVSGIARRIACAIGERGDCR